MTVCLTKCFLDKFYYVCVCVFVIRWRGHTLTKINTQQFFALIIFGRNVTATAVYTLFGYNVVPFHVQLHKMF